VLRASLCRWVNLVLAVLYALSIVGAAIGETSPYYLFLSVVEVVVLLSVVRYAWRWNGGPSG
jgi:hypothetical protein